MKMTDGKKTVEIVMKVWNDFLDSYGPDFSYDFFDVGALPSTDDQETYIVIDVDYCIYAALEWEAENEDNQVFLTLFEM